MSYRPLPTIAVSDPLDILYNGFNGIYEITQQQMLDLFHAIDSLDVIMDMGEIAYNMAFYDDHALTFRGVRGGMQLYYQIVECYDTGVMELRLIEEGHPDYQVLDSKPLPPGRDYYEAYDRYVRLVWPSCCITTDLLEAIMREGHLAPFMKNDELTSGMTLSDDYMLLRFEFYMTDLRKTVFIHEDYRTRDIYYTVYEPGIVPELESTTRDGQAPLKTGAKRSDYTMFSATFESLDSE